MLRIIQNEFAKILHKVSSLVLFIILLLILIGIPVGSKIIDSIDFSSSYYQDLEQSLEYAKQDSYQDPLYIEQLETAIEIGLTSEEYYGNSWRGRALNQAFQYRYILADEELQKNYPKSDVARMQVWSDALLKYTKADDWKGYYQASRDIAVEGAYYSDHAKNVIVNFYNHLIEKEIAPSESEGMLDTLSTYTNTISEYELMKAKKAAGETIDNEHYKYCETYALTSEYALTHPGIEYVFESDNYYSSASDRYIFTGDSLNSLQNGTLGFTIICILFLIVAGTIVSNEYSQGTIKFLLINPVKRQKIFWGKYTTIIILALGVTLFSFALEFIISGIVYGFHGLTAPLLLIRDGSLQVKSGLFLVFGLYMAQFLQLVIAGTIAFMISSWLRNSGLSIALGVLTYTMGGTVAMLAEALHMDFFRYTIFANLNVPNIVAGIYPFTGMTAGFSATVIIIHMILMLFIARDAFVRKNV